MNRAIIKAGIAAIVLLGLSCAGCTNYSVPGPDAISSPTDEGGVPVEPADRFVVFGAVVPAQWADLSFEIGGRIAAVLVEVGSEVQEGQPLLELDAADLDHAVSQASAALVAAEADLAQLEAGSTAQQIAVAQADVQVAQAELDLLIAPASPEELVAAEMALETAQVAVSLAQAEYDQVAWGGTSAPHLGLVLQEARADYQVAVANYEALLRGPTEEEIGVAQAQLERSQAQLNVLRAGPAPEEIAALQARVDQAEVLVSQAESDLEKAILRAPFAGSVGLVRKRAGELVAPGESVVVIGDLSDLRIETTDLSEIHIPSIGLGQEAEVTFDALPGRTLVGHVALIAPMADISDDGIRYTVILELAQQDADLQWGMSAIVELVAD